MSLAISVSRGRADGYLMRPGLEQRAPHWEPEFRETVFPVWAGGREDALLPTRLWEWELLSTQGQGKATQPEAEWRSAPCPGEQLAEDGGGDRGGGSAKGRSGSERQGLTGKDRLAVPEPSVSSLTV